MGACTHRPFAYGTLAPTAPGKPALI